MDWAATYRFKMGSTPDALKYASIGLNTLGALSNKGAVGSDALAMARQVQQDEIQKRALRDHEIQQEQMVDMQIGADEFLDSKRSQLPQAEQNIFGELINAGQPDRAMNEIQQFLQQHKQNGSEARSEKRWALNEYQQEAGAAATTLQRTADDARKQAAPAKEELKGMPDYRMQKVIQSVEGAAKDPKVLESFKNSKNLSGHIEGALKVAGLPYDKRAVEVMRNKVSASLFSNSFPFGDFEVFKSAKKPEATQAALRAFISGDSQKKIADLENTVKTKEGEAVVAEDKYKKITAQTRAAVEKVLGPEYKRLGLPPPQTTQESTPPPPPAGGPVRKYSPSRKAFFLVYPDGRVVPE